MLSFWRRPLALARGPCVSKNPQRAVAAFGSIDADITIVVITIIIITINDNMAMGMLAVVLTITTGMLAIWPI